MVKNEASEGRTRAEQRAINLVAREEGREYAEEHSELIIAQARAKIIGVDEE